MARKSVLESIDSGAIRGSRDAPLVGVATMVTCSAGPHPSRVSIAVLKMDAMSEIFAGDVRQGTPSKCRMWLRSILHAPEPRSRAI